MAAFNKFQDFSEQIAKSVHNFATHVFKVGLTNTAPLATDAVYASIVEITAGNGYTAGGAATTVTTSEVAGTMTISGTEVVFTASVGTIGPFRYAVLYNDTATIPAKALVGYWDYGSSITLAVGESFTWKPSNTSPGAILTIS